MENHSFSVSEETFAGIFDGVLHILRITSMYSVGLKDSEYVITYMDCEKVLHRDVEQSP